MKRKPKKQISDIVHTISKTGLSFFVGPAAELFNLIIAPPIEKRKDEWIESIAQDLLKLEKKFENFELNKLKSNDTFITIVLHASQLAIRNHQKEKLNALKNAILNSAITSIDNDKQLMFLNFIDTLTPLHLSILNFFNNPKKYNPPNLDWKRKKLFEIFPEIFPDFESNKELAEIIIKDLFSKGLITIQDFTIYASPNTPLTTKFGKEFINYINSPL